MLNHDERLQIIETLEREFPEPKAPLNFSNPFELLVAVMLSAQCTDERVNQTTPQFFPQYNTPEKLLSLGQETFRNMIYSCGYHNQKAKAVMGTCRALIERHNSQVPQTMEELSKLPGVGRKTAGVVLAQAFGVPAFPVDTHVFRVANRIGLVEEKTRDKTNVALRNNIPQDKWIDFHLQLIFHGRKSCRSQKPKCGTCPLKTQCTWKEKENYF